MRKLVYISVLVLTFTLIITGVSYALEDFATQDPEELEKFADIILSEEREEVFGEDYFDDIEPEEAAIYFYSLSYNLSEDNTIKKRIDNKVRELRKSDKIQEENIAFGFNFEDNIHAQMELLPESRKAEFNLDDFMVYKLTLLNESDTEININLFMTDITAISEHSQQHRPIDYSGLMGLDIPFNKIGELQDNLQGDQTIYPGAEDSIFLIFRKHFTPDKVIVDGIMGEGFLDDKRIDIEFIGL